MSEAFSRSGFWIRKVLLPVLTILMLQGMQVSGIKAEPQKSDQAFQAYSPIEVDEYVQIWNLNFKGEGYAIQFMFMVSNVGPGDWNNGSALIIHNVASGSQSYTQEHTDESLQAEVGKFGIRSATNELRIVNGEIQAYGEFSDTKIQLHVRPDHPGTFLHHWTLQEKDFFRVGVPIAHGNATVTLQQNNTAKKIKGHVVMDTILTNVLPHHYAKRLILLRGPDPVLLIGFQGQDGKYQMRLFVQKREVGSTPGSGQWYEEAVSRVEEVNMEEDPFSGYQVPEALMVQSAECSYLVQRKVFLGGMYVFGSVSRFFAWILHFFFAKPFILNYQGQLIADCKESRGQVSDELLSFFIFKE